MRTSRSIERPAACLVALGLAAGGCAGGRWTPPAPLADDRRHVAAAPAVRKYDAAEDSFDRQFEQPVERALDLSRQVRALAGRPKQALNVDAFDEVRDSAWFTNRNARRRLSPDAIRRGPDTTNGPDTTSAWTVVRAKSEGVTPGFTILDGRGERWLVKFDPPGFPEIGSGADVVSTKLFHAAGYNMPEDHVVVFDPATLRIAEHVKFTDRTGRKRDLVRSDVDALLNEVARRPDGRVRGLASRYVAGKVLGPFTYQGTRRDDPNDLVPHEHRRELRGLRVLSAWLNHFDTKDGNSLDVFATEDGRSFVKHYLLDVSSTLGSGSDHAAEPWIGHKTAVDPGDALASLAMAGLYVRPWEKLEGVRYPAVGIFESRTFDPGDYEFFVPNPAFANCTGRDGFWGAKLVMSFTDEQIAAAVEAGRYSDPEAAAYLVRTLVERRDATGRHWFARLNPLDRFEVDPPSALRWVDLAVEYGLEPAAQTRYQCELFADGSRISGNDAGMQAEPRFSWITHSLPGTPHRLELRIRTRRGSGPWSKSVRVFLEREPQPAAGYRLIGIERED